MIPDAGVEACFFCAWLNLVERSVRVGEAVGSTPAAQTDRDSSECRLAAKPPVLGTGFREFDSLHSDRLTRFVIPDGDTTREGSLEV